MTAFECDGGAEVGIAETLREPVCDDVHVGLTSRPQT